MFFGRSLRFALTLTLLFWAPARDCPYIVDGVSSVLSWAPVKDAPTIFRFSVPTILACPS